MIETTGNDPVVFKSLPCERGWKVTRDDRLVAHYPTQHIAERAAARLAKAETSKGKPARAVLHKRDGSVASERSYTRLTTPWLHAGSRHQS